MFTQQPLKHTEPHCHVGKMLCIQTERETKTCRDLPGCHRQTAYTKIGVCRFPFKIFLFSLFFPSSLRLKLSQVILLAALTVRRTCLTCPVVTFLSVLRETNDCWYSHDNPVLIAFMVLISQIMDVVIQALLSDCFWRVWSFQCRIPHYKKHFISILWSLKKKKKKVKIWTTK